MDKADSKYLKMVGNRIAQLRKEKGMTQEEVCTELDMDKPYLSSIENGRQNPTLLTLKKITDAIEIDLKDILDI